MVRWMEFCCALLLILPQLSQQFFLILFVLTLRAEMYAQLSLWWKIVLCIGNVGAVMWSVQWWCCVKLSLCDNYAWYTMNHSLNSCLLITYFYNFSVNFQWVLWMPMFVRKNVHTWKLCHGQNNFSYSRDSQKCTPYWLNTPPSDQNVKLILFYSVMYSIPETC